MHSSERLPFFAAITCAENVADLLARYAPCGNVDVFGILRVDGDVIENVIIATQTGKPRPLVSRIVGGKKVPGAGAHQDMARVGRIISQAARVATVRPECLPGSGSKQRCTCQAQ